LRFRRTATRSTSLPNRQPVVTFRPLCRRIAARWRSSDARAPSTPAYS
jgi:hypothetical protein